MVITMARPLRMMTLLPGLAFRTVTPRVSSVSCRFLSKRHDQVRTERNHRSRTMRHNDDGAFEDTDMEDVEDKLQHLFLEERRKSKMLKFNILRRKMRPPGPPDRKLTWQSIEQIRYLKQEHPEEWTVERLAEGFSVSTDAILRVLKSKFVPPPERKARQDTKVMERLGHLALPGGTGTVSATPKLSAPASLAALSNGHSSTDLVPVSDRSVAVTAQSSAPVLVQGNHLMSNLQKTSSPSVTEDYAAEASTEGSTEQEEEWDGLVLSEQEIEELVDQEMSPPPAILQVGNDFFDSNGNFLFRI